MPRKRFEVITRDYPLNKRKGFDNLEDAYIYWKNCPNASRNGRISGMAWSCYYERQKNSQQDKKKAELPVLEENR